MTHRVQDALFGSPILAHPSASSGTGPASRGGAKSMAADSSLLALAHPPQRVPKGRMKPTTPSSQLPERGVFESAH
jgi:hypothetical protein